MAQQIALSRPLILGAVLVSSSCRAASSLRPTNAGAPTRLSMNFTDETAETVIGCVESPGNEQLRVIDVAQVEFPSEDSGDVKYTVVADEAVLSKYDELLVKEARHRAEV
ncbi:hypothetical protein FOZ62_016776 [Perkinsus olseni]|uniref:Uncharacterized protein n=1 Tax=Perkinsus olseni TaxID=32597 RepID=A0A7J6T2A4_PEROL|nr:hypothetical protein FOZ62_016776 [Perkinsus olseni]